VEALRPAGDGREEQDLRGRRDRRVEAAQQANVVAVDEDVEEARDTVALEHTSAQSRELHDQSVQRLAYGSCVDVDEALPARVGAQHGWDADLRHCFKRYSKGGSSR
jgi:hypothetical protein